MRGQSQTLPRRKKRAVLQSYDADDASTRLIGRRKECGVPGENTVALRKTQVLDLLNECRCCDFITGQRGISHRPWRRIRSQKSHTRIRVHVHATARLVSAQKSLVSHPPSNPTPQPNLSCRLSLEGYRTVRLCLGNVWTRDTNAFMLSSAIRSAGMKRATRDMLRKLQALQVE